MPDTPTETHQHERPAVEQERLALLLIGHPDASLVGSRRLAPPGLPLLLGRAEDSCLPGAFDDGKVSRRHAEIRWDDGQPVVHDLGSRNGTFVNGQPITARPLQEGDVLTVGRLLFMLHRGPAAYPRPGRHGMVGIGPSLADVEAQIDTVAATDTVVTIVGDTGTGKELVAAALHRASGRSGNLVALNCAGVVGPLLASELFGHVRGAFTSADARRDGLVAAAAQGTLFLDELTDASATFQASLLRLLETGRYRPVGSDRELTARTRFVCACQPQVHDAVADGTFRSDLWARMSRWVIALPPLRRRREDIPALARHFCDRPLSIPLLHALVGYDWPQNVRELQAVIERAMLSQTGDTLELDAWLEQRLGGRGADDDDGVDAAPVTAHLEQGRGRPSREGLIHALRAERGSVRAVAKRFGVARKTVYRWITLYDLDLDALRLSE